MRNVVLAATPGIVAPNVFAKQVHRANGAEAKFTYNARVDKSL